VYLCFFHLATQLFILWLAIYLIIFQMALNYVTRKNRRYRSSRIRARSRAFRLRRGPARIRMSRFARRARLRRFRSRSRRGRGSRGSNAARARLMNLLQPTQRFTSQHLMVVDGTSASDDYGVTNTYFAGAVRNRGDDTTYPGYASTLNVDALLRIAHDLVPNPPPFSVRLTVPKSRLQYTLYNRTTAATDITAYYLQCRRDLPNAHSIYDVIEILSTGFVAAGVGDTTTGQGLLRADLSPFDSSNLCSYFSIYKVKSRHMPPGTTAKFNISDSKMRYIDVGRVISPDSASETFLTADVTVAWLKGSKCILFRNVPQLAQNDTTEVITSAKGSIQMLVVHRLTYKFTQPIGLAVNYFGSTGVSDAAAPVEIISETTGLKGTEVKPV